MARPSLITTPPTIRPCGRCGAFVLAAWSEGLRTVADLTPITTTGQILATIAGIWLYRLTPTGLHHIDQSAARRAHEWLVVPDHRCGVVWPPQPGDPPPDLLNMDQPSY